MTRTNPKPATCDKCGSTDVAWFKSKRTGKFYLCEVFTDAEGDRISSSRDFHSKYCGVAGAHKDEQNRIAGMPNHAPVNDDAAENRAWEISNLGSVTTRVLAIADLVRENPALALAVRNVWRRQGENMLADILEGAAGITPVE